MSTISENNFQTALFEIVTDPYEQAGAIGSIYSYNKYDLELPTSQIGVDFIISNNLLFFYPSNFAKSLTDNS